MAQTSSLDTAARRRTRRVLIQLIYQWQLTEEALATLRAQFMLEIESKEADLDYFDRVMDVFFEVLPQLDAQLSKHLSRDFNELTMVEKAVLRLAAFELLHCPDVPYKAVINEALELNKRFGAKEGHRFVNGVLDALARECRAEEIGG